MTGLHQFSMGHARISQHRWRVSDMLGGSLPMDNPLPLNTFG